MGRRDRIVVLCRADIGEGVITGTSGSGASMIVQIRFDNGAVKKLAAGFAPLEILR